MLGKGAKRKLDEDEEGLEGEALASPVASPAGEPVRGPEGPSIPEGLSKVSYTLQRQTIFNISLMKLYSQRPLTEPSLERRVLINNMLRRIQNELKQEGSLRPLLLPPSPPPDDPMDEGFREAPPSSFGALSAAAAGGAAVPPSNQPQSGLLMPALAPPSPHPLAPPTTCLSSQPSSAPLLEACLTPASLLEEDGDSAFCASSSPPPTPPLSPPSPPALPPSALTPLPLAPLSSLLLGQGSLRGPAPVSSNDSFPSTPTDMELDPPTAILSRTVSAAALTSTASTTTTSPSPSPPAQTPPLIPLPPSTTAAGHPRDGSTRTIGSPRPEVHGVVSTEVRPMDILPAHVPMHAPVPTSGLADITSPSLPSSPPSSSSPPSAGFLSDLALDDILFADIDTSMYDFDPCTTTSGATAAGAAAGGTLGVVTATAAGVAVGPGPGGGLSKLSPVVTADDLLKSLACPYGGPTQQVSANQPFKIDLTELDHIMEVLVGS